LPNWAARPRAIGVFATNPASSSLFLVTANRNLSQKHVGMIVRQLEAAGFNRDTVRRDLNAR
jgi:hypothetical protein